MGESSNWEHYAMVGLPAVMRNTHIHKHLWLWFDSNLCNPQCSVCL